MSGIEQPDPEVDIPLSVAQDTAEEILDDLQDGTTVTLELQPEHSRNLIEQMEWQLENGQPVTELAEAFTEAEE